MKVYDQTGRVYWDSTGDDGERKSPPITPLASNTNVAQLNILVQQYNFELERLREEMGISEYQDGSSIPVKTGLGVMQNQVQGASNATEYIYDAYTTLMEDTCKKVSMMLWDLVIFKAKKFKEFEGYDVSLLDMSFDVNVDMMADDRAKAELHQLMNTALESGALTYEQAFKIKNIDDVKLAELYLSRSVKRAKKEAQEAAQRNSEMNAKIMQSSKQQQLQQEAQLEQLKTQGKIATNESKEGGDKDLALIQFASSIYSAAFNSGKDIPEELKGMIDSILGTAVQERLKKAQQKEQAEQQAQQQAQMQAQQQGEEGQQEESNQQ